MPYFKKDWEQNSPEPEKCEIWPKKETNGHFRKNNIGDESSGWPLKQGKTMNLESRQISQSSIERPEWISRSNGSGEMTVKMFSSLSENVKRSANCDAVFSMPGHCFIPVTRSGSGCLGCPPHRPAEPPRCLRTCHQLTVAGCSWGQRAQGCAVKQRDAMGSDISNTDLTGYTYLCVNARWWKRRCKSPGRKTPCPELLQSKSSFLLI